VVKEGKFLVAEGLSGGRVKYAGGGGGEKGHGLGRETGIIQVISRAEDEGEDIYDRGNSTDIKSVTDIAVEEKMAFF